MGATGPMFIISPDGMLGRAFEQALRARQIPFAGARFPQVDITDEGSLARAVPTDTRVVLNCAAYTNVDGAETDEATATRVNGEGTRNLARLCLQRGMTLVHFSTDYVFDGNASEPYTVDAPHDPVNAYGRSKAAGETALWETGCEHLLLRTSWLYAPWANNFVRTMAKLSRDRDTLTVVDDQKGRPSSAPYVAERTLDLLATKERGTFHVTDGGECTWFAFTEEIVRKLGRRTTVNPCSSDNFPRPAKRPPYSVLSLERIERVLGPSRPWQDNLADTLEQLEPLE